MHAVIADFQRRESVSDAIAALERSGFGPADVTLVAGDPELARDLGGRSFVRLGVIAGALAGLTFTAAVLLIGGPERMFTEPVGFAIGALGVIGGLAFIGLVFGRALVSRSADAELFADQVRRGDVLVAVCCDGERCQRARTLLERAGAADIHEEASPGPT